MADYGGSGDHFNDCSGIGGCDCDERRYGSHGSGGGGGCLLSLISFVIAMGTLYAIATAGGAILFVILVLAVIGYVIMH